MPKKWSAADIGRLFFDRADWGIFLGLFASLWNKVAEHHRHRQATCCWLSVSQLFANAPLRCPGGWDMQSARPLS